LRNVSPKGSPLKPRPRPPWKTQLASAQFGDIAEDLVGVTFAAAAAGSGAVAMPFVDRGVDLYLRRLLTLLTIPLQVKAVAHVEPDGAATLSTPTEDLHGASGWWVVVHLPAPHDQLYRRIYLIPVTEIRRRSKRVIDHGTESYRFTVNFAGTADDAWSQFALDVEDLPTWIAGIPGWINPITPAASTDTASALSPRDDIGTVGTAALSNLWAIQELERAGNGSIVVAQDRTRLDTVSLLIHHLPTGGFAGLHVRTAFFDETRRTHFEVKRLHFFTDPNLWVLLVLRRRDQSVQDFVLLIPSEDIPKLGFSETMTLDPLTKRFRKYQLPAADFGKTFMEIAFPSGADRVRFTSHLHLRKAS
jgi:hypothetical protein